MAIFWASAARGSCIAPPTRLARHELPAARRIKLRLFSLDRVLRWCAELLAINPEPARRPASAFPQRRVSAIASRTPVRVHIPTMRHGAQPGQAARRRSHGGDSGLSKRNSYNASTQIKIDLARMPRRVDQQFAD